MMTRTDDIINVAAHRLSTGEIEEVLAAHPDVAECAVIGVADALKGQVPLGLLVLKSGVKRPSDEVEREAVGGAGRDAETLREAGVFEFVHRVPDLVRSRGDAEADVATPAKIQVPGMDAGPFCNGVDEIAIVRIFIERFGRAAAHQVVIHETERVLQHYLV